METNNEKIIKTEPETKLSKPIEAKTVKESKSLKSPKKEKKLEANTSPSQKNELSVKIPNGYHRFLKEKQNEAGTLSKEEKKKYTEHLRSAWNSMSSNDQQVYKDASNKDKEARLAQGIPVVAAGRPKGSGVSGLQDEFKKFQVEKVLAIDPVLAEGVSAEVYALLGRAAECFISKVAAKTKTMCKNSMQLEHLREALASEECLRFLSDTIWQTPSHDDEEMDSKQTKSKRKAGKITPKPKAALEVERSGLSASANPARGVSKATKKEHEQSPKRLRVTEEAAVVSSQDLDATINDTLNNSLENLIGSPSTKIFNMNMPE